MKMTVRKYILVLFAFLLLVFAGCKLGPNYKSPELEVSEQYRFDSLMVDTLANFSWWELFQDQQLNSLINIAIQENKDVKIAGARIAEARAFMGVAKADLYPKFDIQAQATRGTFIGNQVLDDPANLYLIAPTLSWELDFWGKLRRSTEAAQAELMAQEYAHRQILISLISEVTSTYFVLLDFNSRLEIARRTLATRRESLRIIQERFDKGIVAEIDLNQAQIQEAIAATAVPSFERAVAQTEHTLSILLGRNPVAVRLNVTLQDQTLPPNIPPGLPSQLLARRPDLLQAEEILHAQTARIGVAEAARLPSISLTGLVGVVSTDLSNLTSGDAVAWNLSGQLLGPLFAFGKNKRKVEIERYRTEQALYDYEQSVLIAFAEVEDALIEVETLGREFAARTRQLNAASNAASLSQARYDGGVTSYLEVLESDRSQFDAALATSQTRQQQLNAYVKLYKALGGGWISPAEQGGN